MTTLKSVVTPTEHERDKGDFWEIKKSVVEFHEKYFTAFNLDRYKFMSVGGMGRERDLGRYGNTVFHGDDTADSDSSRTQSHGKKR